MSSCYPRADAVMGRLRDDELVAQYRIGCRLLTTVMLDWANGLLVGYVTPVLAIYRDLWDLTKLIKLTVQTVRSIRFINIWHGKGQVCR